MRVIEVVVQEQCFGTTLFELSDERADTCTERRVRVAEFKRRLPARRAQFVDRVHLHPSRPSPMRPMLQGMGIGHGAAATVGSGGRAARLDHALAGDNNLAVGGANVLAATWCGGSSRR